MKTTHTWHRTLTLALYLCALLALSACNKAESPDATSAPASSEQEAADSPRPPTEEAKGQIDEDDLEKEDEAETEEGKKEAEAPQEVRDRPIAEPDPRLNGEGSNIKSPAAPSARPQNGAGGGAGTGDKKYREEFGVE